MVVSLTDTHKENEQVMARKVRLSFGNRYLKINPYRYVSSIKDSWTDIQTDMDR